MLFHILQSLQEERDPARQRHFILVTNFTFQYNCIFDELINDNSHKQLPFLEVLQLHQGVHQQRLKQNLSHLQPKEMKTTNKAVCLEKTKKVDHIM